MLITTAVAVIVAQAIERIAQVPVGIKWVNDIFIGPKKVCGILTEASINFENGGLEYAIVGIGINISTNGFPEEIKEIAGAVFEEKPEDAPVTSMLVADILNHIAKDIDILSSKEYLDEYRKRSFLLGQEVLVMKGSEILPAKAIAIDEKARLVVEYQNKEQEALVSGEVSVRPSPQKL
jgi:BirA family biotin operon repressor/biotin-[acetyl-CoA-carboxylase] ligase